MSAIDGGSAVTPLNFADLQERLRSHVYALYMNYSFLIKGGVYTVAALALLHILTEQILPFRRGLLVFWSVSFAFSLVTIAKWSRGSVMTNARANMIDTLAPIGMGIPEYLLFIVLDPEFTKRTSWTVWYVVFAIHAIFAFILVANRLRQTSIEDDYSSEMRSLAQRYVIWMKTDLIGTSILATASLTLFAATRYVGAILAMPGSELYHTIIGGMACLLGLYVIWEAYSQYNEILRFRPVSVPTPA